MRTTKPIVLGMSLIMVFLPNEFSATRAIFPFRPVEKRHLMKAAGAESKVALQGMMLTI